MVTPSFNQAQFLEASIQSVLLQDPGSAARMPWQASGIEGGTLSDETCRSGLPLEYIIVDGGSTDGSVEIIRRYADHLAWWVSEKDSGQAEAINKGMQHTRGEFIAWLNSDDLYLPGALQQAVAVLQAYPEVGMVFGDAITMDAAGHPLNPLVFGAWGLPELMRFRIICQPAVVMRRSVWQAVGGLDPSFHYMLDHHLWLRIARQAPVRHVTACWAAARAHPQAKNVLQSDRFAAETLRLLEWLRNHPDYVSLWDQERQIKGGAYRLAARYSLEGDQPAQALRYYLQALRFYPAYALQHWHRMIYALLSLMGAGRSAIWYYRYKARARRRNFDLNLPGIQNWPGINLYESQ